MNIMTAAQARQKARELREEAMKQTSAGLRAELKQVADQYERLAAELERLEQQK